VDDFCDVTRDVLQKCWERRAGVDMALTGAACWRAQVRLAADELRGREIMGAGEWVRESLAYGGAMVKRRIWSELRDG